MILDDFPWEHEVVPVSVHSDRDLAQTLLDCLNHEFPGEYAGLKDELWRFLDLRD